MHHPLCLPLPFVLQKVLLLLVAVHFLHGHGCRRRETRKPELLRALLVKREKATTALPDAYTATV